MSKEKDKAIEKKKGLKKVHQSVRHCRHCGEVVSKEVRHESGHNEYDHERTHPLVCKG